MEEEEILASACVIENPKIKLGGGSGGREWRTTQFSEIIKLQCQFNVVELFVEKRDHRHALLTWGGLFESRLTLIHD